MNELLPAGWSRYVRVFHRTVDGSLSPREVATRNGVAWHGELSYARLNSLAGEGNHFSVGEPDPITRESLVDLLWPPATKCSLIVAWHLAPLLAGADSPLCYEVHNRAELESTPYVAAEHLATRYADVQSEVDAPSGPGTNDLIRVRPLVGPEFTWSVDRSWLMVSDYDLESSYLACSTQQMEALMTDRVLACAEVSLDSRIDSYSDAS